MKKPKNSKVTRIITIALLAIITVSLGIPLLYVSKQMKSHHTIDLQNEIKIQFHNAIYLENQRSYFLTSGDEEDNFVEIGLFFDSIINRIEDINTENTKWENTGIKEIISGFLTQRVKSRDPESLLKRVDSLFSLLLSPEFEGLDYVLSFQPLNGSENGIPFRIGHTSIEKSKFYKKAKLISIYTPNLEGRTDLYYISDEKLNERLSLPFTIGTLIFILVIGSFIFIAILLMRQQKINNLKNDFIGNVSHELKTPITTISLVMESLEQSLEASKSETVKRYVNIAKTESYRLSLLVDRVLKITDYEHKTLKLHKELFKPKEVVGQVVNSFEPLLRKIDGAIHFESTLDDECTLNTDKLHFTGVIYNMIDNAIKYRKEHPIVIVNLYKTENCCVIQIKDNGIGINPKFQKKIFDKFYRINKGNIHETKGHGLGLSYVSQIIKSVKGEISLKSNLNEGSIFTIKWPFRIE